MNELFEVRTVIDAYRSVLRWCIGITRYSQLLAVFLCCAVTFGAKADSNTAAVEAAQPIHLGLLPHLSSELLIKRYKPLIDYLEQYLQQPVIVSTAPDFETYIERATQGRYDLFLTAPHIAAYHERHDRHRRLARFSNELHGVILVRRDSSYGALKDLQGKKVVAPDSLAVITLLGEVTFQENGIDIDKDVNTKYTRSHNNAIRTVSEGKAEAAIVGMPVYKMVQANASLRVPMRILSKTNAIPHMMFMSPPRLSEAQTLRFRQALLSFSADGAGKAFFIGTPFGDMVEISDQDMLRLAAMLSLLERRLEK